jgi:hypothetical protein
MGKLFVRLGGVALLCAACGSVKEPNNLDAQPGPPDSPPPDAAPTVLTLNPEIDADIEDSNRDGSFDLVRNEENDVVIVRRISTDEFRCAFEFDISGVPLGANVQKAEFTISIVFGASPGVLVEPHGYAGNGVITVGDADVVSSIGAPFVPLAMPSTTLDVTALVRGLRTSGQGHAGFLFRPASTSDLTSIHSSESSVLEKRPKLVITYTN